MEWVGDARALYVRNVAVQGASGLIAVTTVASWLFGWALTESSGAAAATFALYDGQVANGQVVALVQLAANGTSIVHPGVTGWPCRSGLTLAVTAGAVTGSLTLGGLA